MTGTFAGVCDGSRPSPTTRATTRHRLRQARKGVATLWLLAAGGVLALLLIFLTDTARLYLARIEMQNALDAAALSGVKTRCQLGVSALGDGQARQDAQATYLANFPATSTPSAVAMSLNGGGAGANGNDRCPPLQVRPDGLVLLGSIYYPASGTPTRLDFDADTVPNTARVIIQAPAAAHTFAAPSLFTLKVEGDPPAKVKSVTIDLANVGAVFDPGMGVSEADGYGPFPSAPATPIANYSLNENSGSSPLLTVNFDGGLGQANAVQFGMDTDFASNAVADMTAAQLTGADVQIELSDGSTHDTSFTLQGSVVAGEIVLGVNECAVQVHGCVEVKSIAPSFLGTLFGPYQVRGRSTAWLRKAGLSPEPELVRVDGVICNGFALP